MFIIKTMTQKITAPNNALCQSRVLPCRRNLNIIKIAKYNIDAADAI